VKPGTRDDFQDGFVRFLAGPCHEQALAGAHQTLGDGGNLVGSFALSEHHFRKTLTDRSMVIDAREPEIFVRGLA
jgi:hypothetical protein